MSAKSELHPEAAPLPGGISRERLLELYRLMLLSRHLDDREILLKRQQKIFFQISGAGHEAVQLAAAERLRAGKDWFYLYYRDRALCLGLGVAPADMLLQSVGAGSDPASGGRQMPSHWSDPRRHIVSGSSPTGTQFLQAIGCAEAGRQLRRRPELEAWLTRHPGPQAVEWDAEEITLVSGGEGATSEGEFWEAVNTASREKLPVLFLIEDNGYAISVPVEVQMAGGSISALLAGFPALLRRECDGCDLFASLAALDEAITWCRGGNGPALVHAHVTRPYSHSLSDDERMYRLESEREAEAERDPLRRLRHWLLEKRLAGAAELKTLAAAVQEEILAATDAALAAAPAADADSQLYSPAIDITSERFDTAAQNEGPPRTMVELINACLRDEMRRDPRILVMGEDVADCSREDNLDKVKGKGGVFKVTAGLQREFGGERVFNTPLAEAAIVGRAIGLATRGLKPAAEIQFFDYIWPAMMQIRNELALLRWRSAGGWAAPLVLRVPIGGYLTGGAIYHSQCGEVLFTHIPGLRIAMPSNALDANGLLRTALRGDDPVMFLEHKRLYREPFNRHPYPGPDFCIPFGRARLVQAGHDLTVITYGAVVQRALQAAQRLAREQNASIEILDLRTLLPYDWEAIAASVGKTGKVIVAYEDMRSWGYGAELAARISEELFDSLDAPVRRVAARDLFCAYQPKLEDEILPQADDLYHALSELLRY